MHLSIHAGRSLASLAFAGLALASAQAVMADNPDEKCLSLRIPAAMSRFAPYADVAGVGGASAGSRWSSSVNPASTAWEPVPGDLHLSLSPQYSQIHFANDTTLHVAAEALVWDLGDWGTLQPSLAQVRSNRKDTLQGPDFRMDMDMEQLQWAKKVNPDWSLGANFNFSKCQAKFDLDPAPVCETNGETYGLRLGSLNRLAQGLLAGVVFDYAASPSRTTRYDVQGLGDGNARVRDTGQQYIVRPGLSYEYWKDCTLLADYQFGTFRDRSGSLTVDRFYVGAEHAVLKGVYMRGGVALDANGKAAWATGFGLSPTQRFSIDVGYQDNMFPELAPELGRSHTLTISIGFTF
jgi:hypothetical protein